jgi:hypothetical protein
MGERRPLLWGLLVQMGFNTYADRDAPTLCAVSNNIYLSVSPSVRFDRGLWHELVEAMVANGLNAVVIAPAEALRYASHPELAAEGALSVAELREELARLRRLGIEPIPKINFSTAHDTWLGPYGRQVSTDAYYRVCADLIAETIEIFDTPRLFHLGFDEEDLANQSDYEYAVIRQHDLWWRDFLFFVDQVERAGVRPWIWSDYLWDHLDEFAERMPRSVVQSNWYYDPNFDLAYDDANYEQSRLTHTKDTIRDPRTRTTPLRAYLELERLGFDQIPAGSTTHTYGQPVDNFEGTVPFCVEQIAPERLLGFLQTVWRPVVPGARERFLASIEAVGRARATYERGN